MEPFNVELELKNETPDEVTFWLYDPATRKSRDSKVIGGGNTIVVITEPGSRLIGAWHNGPAGPSLYPDNAGPFTVVGDVPDGTQNYVVVLNSGGISFDPQ